MVGEWDGFRWEFTGVLPPEALKKALPFAFPAEHGTNPQVSAPSEQAVVQPGRLGKSWESVAMI